MNNNAINPSTIMNSLCVVHVDTDVWSGKISLHDSELKLGVDGEAPPKDFASLGQKKMINPATLKPFEKFKGRIRTLFSKHAAPFLSGHGIPDDKELMICQELDQIVSDWHAAEAFFELNYDDEIERWAQEKDKDDPIYGRAVRTCKLPISEVKKRFGIKYHVYKIQPTQHDSGSSTLGSKVESLGGDLVSELVKQSQETYYKYLLGKDTVSKRSLEKLVVLRDKVNGLSFLNASFGAVVKLLDETIATIDFPAKERHVSGRAFYQVVATVLTMSDAERLKAYAEGTYKPNEHADALYWGSIDDEQPAVLPETTQNEEASSVNADLAAEAFSEIDDLLSEGDDELPKDDVSQSVDGLFDEFNDSESVTQVSAEVEQSESMETEISSTVTESDFSDLDMLFDEINEGLESSSAESLEEEVAEIEASVEQSEDDWPPVDTSLLEPSEVSTQDSSDCWF